MKNLKCKVEECTYNDNCYCMANEIEVCSCGDRHVEDAEKTFCKTFCCKDR